MRKLKLQEPSPPRGKFPVLPPTPPREASEPFPATWPLSHDLVWFDGAVGLGGGVRREHLPFEDKLGEDDVR